MLRRKSWTFPNSSGKSFLILKESYQIHLCNFVHFQYIQADIHIHVIQWCSYTLHPRDKNGFRYTRQHLSNHRQEKDLTITLKLLWISHCLVEDCKPWLLSILNWIARTRDFLKRGKQVNWHYTWFSRLTASRYVTKLNRSFPRY